MSYVVFRSESDIGMGYIQFQTLPLTTEGCTYDFELNNSTLVDESHENGKSLHNMSYFYFTSECNFDLFDVIFSWKTIDSSAILNRTCNLILKIVHA